MKEHGMDRTTLMVTLVTTLNGASSVCDDGERVTLITSVGVSVGEELLEKETKNGNFN